MPFPETRLTLIHRIVGQNDGDAWQQFFKHYWRPLCDFVRHTGNLQPQDAEDVAAATFSAIVSNQLLARWNAMRVARLRSMLCAVVRKVLANRVRVSSARESIEKNQQQIIRELSFVTNCDEEDSTETDDLFYMEWLGSLIRQTTQDIVKELLAAGRNEHVRVLYGSICEQRSIREIAGLLDLAPSTADAYYAQTREMFKSQLKRAIQAHVRCYTAPDDWAAEFEIEWQRASAEVDAAGGIEKALRTFGNWSGEILSDAANQPELPQFLDELARANGSLDKK